MNFSRLATMALALSLLLHILIGAGLWLAPFLQLAPKVKPVTVVELISPPAVPASMPVEKKTGQIVQQNEKALNDEKPKDARFVSKNNQTVVKETRAANTGKFSNSGGRNGIQGKVDKPKQKQDEKPVREAELDRQDGDELHKFAPQLKKQAEQDTTPGSGDTTIVASNDHLKDVAIGMQTLLSTRQFLYYSYYNRIKEKLQQYWEPKIKGKVAKIMNSGRSIASTSDKITKTIITLDAKGKLIRVQVIGASGLSDLDEAAVEAFREAAPFPNPPNGIVDQDGYIRIRWDFILEANNGYFPDPKKRSDAQSLAGT